MPYKSKFCSFFITPIMKSIIILLFVCVTTHISFAQDSTKKDSSNTLAFRSLIGIGALNGIRTGVQIRYNELLALEGGVGLHIPYYNILFALSWGILWTPFEEKRLSMHLYTSYSIMPSGVQHEHTQVGAGWLIPVDEETNLRISMGFTEDFSARNTNIITKIAVMMIATLDLTMTFDHTKIRF